MKVRRFFANDTREAMRQVRDTFGADAVILSNRRAGSGIEVVAAIDYDEKLMQKARNPQQSVQHPRLTAKQKVAERDAIKSAEPTLAEKLATNRFGQAPSSSQSSAMSNEVKPSIFKHADENAIEISGDPAIGAMRDELHSLRGLLEHQLSGLAWQDHKVRKPEEAELFRRFLVMGIEMNLAKQLSQQIVKIMPNTTDSQEIWYESLDKLAALIPVIGHDIVNNGGIVALVGPTGVGKTTTIVKLAARYVMANGPEKLGIISLDSNRVGSSEQLKKYGRVLGVPTRVVDDMDQCSRVIEAFYDKSLILIDTPGCHTWVQPIRQQLKHVQKHFGKLDLYLVLSASAQYSMLTQTINQYRTTHLKGAIVTKLDEAVSLGEVISALIAYDCPVAYTTDGQAIPEHIRVALAEQIVSAAVQIGKDEAGAPEEALAMRMGEIMADAK